MKILVLGGYGTFGGRLVRLLADEARLTLFVAGRSKVKAVHFCHKKIFRGPTFSLDFDRDGDVLGQLQALRPDLVVDASGPFQLYGDDPYRVVKACLACNIHYIDLADAPEFVNGISQFEDEAKAKNLVILAGASSFPVLTAAAVRQLSIGMTRLDSIKAGIAPSPYAGVGLNVLKAITAYAGKPMILRRDGQPTQVYALTESMRYTISPPGHQSLPSIRFSLVDVPDLQVLPQLWPDVKTVWTGAGPAPEILLRLLNMMAWLVRLRVLPSLLPFAGLFYKVINTVRWGKHRGGMFVSIAGEADNGKPLERSWHLLAEGGDGPLIPSMTIEAIVRKWLDGKAPMSGARSAATELELSDYEKLFKRRTIYTGQKDAA